MVATKNSTNMSKSSKEIKKGALKKKKEVVASKKPKDVLKTKKERRNLIKSLENYSKL